MFDVKVLPRWGWLLGVVVIFISGCTGNTALHKRTPNTFEYAAAIKKPLPPEETKELLGEVAGNWFYGHGLGSTMLNAGTAVAFPPYALLLLGNAALTLSGYEPLGVSSILPEKERESWSELYDTVTSGPGRLTAAVSGEEFRTRAIAKQRLEKYISIQRGPEEVGMTTPDPPAPRLPQNLNSG